MAVNLIKIPLPDLAADRVRRNHEQAIEELQRDARELQRDVRELDEDAPAFTGPEEAQTSPYTMRDGETLAIAAGTTVKAPPNPRNGEMVCVIRTTASAEFLPNDNQAVNGGTISTNRAGLFVFRKEGSRWHRVTGDGS